MSDNADDKLPLALRLSFTPVLIMFFVLIALRFLNTASVYPYIGIESVDAAALAEGRPDARSVEFTTADGVTLYGWVQGSDSARHKIIQFMGNFEQVGPRAEMYAVSCQQLDAQFLKFNYRGCGQSSGSPSEAGLYHDARAAWAYATGELGWHPDEIVLWGRSLGGAPAIKLAEEMIAAETPPLALILEAPFTSIQDMAVVAMPHLGKPEWLVYQAFDNLARAPQLTVPVFHFHGDQDEIIPFEQGERLHAALPGPKHFFVMPGVQHNDIWSDAVRAEELRSRMAEFLREHA